MDVIDQVYQEDRAPKPAGHPRILALADQKGGVGETTICFAPPAVLNANFAATGKRYRTFPLKNHGLSIA